MALGSHHVSLLRGQTLIPSLVSNRNRRSIRSQLQAGHFVFLCQGAVSYSISIALKGSFPTAISPRHASGRAERSLCGTYRGGISICALARAQSFACRTGYFVFRPRRLLRTSMSSIRRLVSSDAVRGGCPSDTCRRLKRISLFVSWSPLYVTRVVVVGAGLNEMQDHLPVCDVTQPS